MQKTLASLALAVTTCGFVHLASAATPAEVRTTIEKAKAYLYKSAQGPHKDNWEVVQQPDMNDKEQFHVTHWQWGGPTGCAVYGLLAGGENPQDKRLAPAIEWLGKQELHGTYAIAMRAQMYPYLPDVTAKPAAGTMGKRQMAERDARLLMAGMLSSPKDLGLYSYYLDAQGNPEKDWCDLSNSQVAVLGVWACEQAGAEIPDRYWQLADAAWKKVQHGDGGWPYRPEDKDARPAMCAAGVATLNITQDFLQHGTSWSVCAGGQRNENIDRGLDWIDKHISGMLQSDGEYGLYQMYGIERIGVASGRKYFGTVDWGSVGADYLIHHQNPDGSFGGNDEFHNPNKVADTTFAILFLVRGRAPLVMNKLEYANATAKGVKGQIDPWNERPRDCANFAAWVGHQLECFFGWQIVNLKVSDRDLHDAPILYISGSEALNLSEEDINKLRNFAEDGGLILGNADCGNGLFSKSFVALAQKLFPKYEMRDLPANHVIFSEDFKPTKWRSKPRLEGVTNGVRELMILIPDADPGKSWQVRSELSRVDNYQLGFDIFEYTGGTIDRLTRPDPYIVERDNKINVPADRKIKVIRLAVDANPDPEPGGWRRLANIMHNHSNVDLEIEPAKLGEGKLKGAKIADITGTTRFNLSPEQEKELKEFVDGGGTLIIDSAGGSADFAGSAEKALAGAFGGQPGNFGTILPPDSPVYQLDGDKIEKVDYRAYCRGRIDGHLTVPRIRGLTVNGRIAVFYSPEDIVAGLVGQKTDGILGYAPDSAVALMRNMILYSAFGQHAAVAHK